MVCDSLGTSSSNCKYLTISPFVGRFTCGQLTFAEAYRKTGRIFCVTLSSTTKKAPPVLLNYLTTPNVTIASAVIASAAVPGFIAPVRLQYSTLTVLPISTSCFDKSLTRCIVERLRQRMLTVFSDLRPVKRTLTGPSSRTFL